MTRLKYVRFTVSVPAPGQNANSVSSQPQWQADEHTEIQVEGGWVAIWRDNHALPHLVPVHQVQFAAPLESPKGFAKPDWEAAKKAREAVAVPGVTA